MARREFRAKNKGMFFAAFVDSVKERYTNKLYFEIMPIQFLAAFIHQSSERKPCTMQFHTLDFLRVQEKASHQDRVRSFPSMPFFLPDVNEFHVPCCGNQKSQNEKILMREIELRIIFSLAG